MCVWGGGGGGVVVVACVCVHEKPTYNSMSDITQLWDLTLINRYVKKDNIHPLKFVVYKK